MDKKYKTKCENCETEFEYTKKNVLIQDFGCAGVICPNCNKTTIADDSFNLKLNEDNIVFPQHFFEFKKNKDFILDEEINNEIKRNIKLLKEQTFTENSIWSRFGDVLIIVLKEKNVFSIFVAKGYYHTEF